MILQRTLVDLAFALHRVERKHNASRSFAGEAAERFSAHKPSSKIDVRGHGGGIPPDDREVKVKSERLA